MQRTIPLLLAASGFATILVAWPGVDQTITATGTDDPSVAEIDSDGDFLPDVGEWVLLTNSSKPDTDGDSQPDFVEVLSGTNPRRPDAAMPQDHELRVVITDPPPGSAGPPLGAPSSRSRPERRSAPISSATSARGCSSATTSSCACRCRRM